MDNLGSKNVVENAAQNGGTEKPHPSENLSFVTANTWPPSAPAVHVENATFQPTHPYPAHSLDSNTGSSTPASGLQPMPSDAKAGTQAEHKMGFQAGLRLYPKAIAWSMLLSLTIVMEGYSTILVNSFFAYPTFRRAYGTFDTSYGFEISPAWQLGLNNSSVVGSVLGLFWGGWLSERFGYRKTLAGALVALSLAILLAFFAVNIQMLLAAMILCGIPWGFFQTLSTSYASEVTPVALRAYVTSNVNLCWLIGQIIGTGIIRGLVNNESEWSYRIPFGLQWAFAVPLTIGVLLAPESPWWLVRHGRHEDAKRALLRLTTAGSESFNVDETVAMMSHTNEVEKWGGSGGTTYFDCFRGTNLRRTEIACMVWITQTLSGLSLTGYAAYIYEQAGISTTSAFDLTIGMYGLAIVGCLLAWIWMRKIGRRTLYMAGLAGCFVVLLATGIVATSSESAGKEWAVGSLIIILTFIWDSTIGPVCYSLVAEIPSSRLRIKTVVLARVAYNISSLATNPLNAASLSPSAWNWGGKASFLWAGTTMLCLIWCYFRLPEPKGLTYIELDILFNKRAGTKKFQELQVRLDETGYFSLTRPETRASVWREGV